MRRRIGAASAVLLILAAASIAAAVGYGVAHKSKPQAKTKMERVLSQAPTPPTLPAYHPGTGWFALPTPPTAQSNTEVGEEEGEQVGEEPETTAPEPEIIETQVKEAAGGNRERCYGISIGPTC